MLFSEFLNEIKSHDKCSKVSGIQIVSSFSLCYDQRRRSDPIYQPLRSGRIWHKVNF